MAQAQGLSTFLLPMLEYAPEKRATAAQMLQHSWLQGILPAAAASPAKAPSRPASRRHSRHRKSHSRTDSAHAAKRSRYFAHSTAVFNTDPPFLGVDSQLSGQYSTAIWLCFGSAGLINSHVTGFGCAAMLRSLRVFRLSTSSSVNVWSGTPVSADTIIDSY